MKNKSIRSLLTTLIIAISLGSYIFLNSGLTSNSSNEKDSLELKVETMTTTEAATLPDIQVTKKIVKFAKQLLPVSQ